MMESSEWTAFWKRMPLRSTAALRVYEKARLHSYKELLKNIPFKDFADLGGGSGYAAKKVAEHFNAYGVIVDNNEEAFKVYKQMGKCRKTLYMKEDLFEYEGEHDLVISDGLIEHFDKETRKRLLEQHKKLSKKYVLIFVPKNAWHVKTFLKYKHGFEKKYTKEEFLRELRNAGLAIMKYREDFHMHGALCSILKSPFSD